MVPTVTTGRRIPPTESCVIHSLAACACSSSSGTPHPSQRSEITLMGVCQRALASLCIRNIWSLYTGVFFVNLIWYLYLFWLNRLSLSLKMPNYRAEIKVTSDKGIVNDISACFIDLNGNMCIGIVKCLVPLMITLWKEAAKNWEC